MTRLLVVAAALLALGAALILRFPPRADLAEFLPPGEKAATAFLFRELRQGAGAALILAAIEGAPPADLARLSRDTASGLRASGRFPFVADGTLRPGEAEEEFLFRHRYLLAGNEDFTAAALRPRLEALLDGLRSAAAPVLARWGFADPTGAFPGLLERWLAGTRLATRDGAWFSPDGERALLLARGEGAGLDAGRQAAAVAAFRAAFAAADPAPGARLLLSGPGVFAAEAAAGIRADVARVSALGPLGLALFLLWRFRSPALAAAVAVPVLAGAVAGYALTLALFGAVHGIALGFGLTMLGVAADHPILLLTLRREGEPLRDAARRLWPSLRLAAAATGAGLLAMLGSGLPGLAQLAVFAAAGVGVAAAATRWLLPALLPAGPGGAPRRLPGLAPLRALAGRRGLALGLAGLVAGALLWRGGVEWQRDLAALSPVPAAQQRLDAALREALGAPDARGLFVLGPFASAEAALAASEALGDALPALVARGALTGAELLSHFLPSSRTQAARQAALPDRDGLAAALREAASGLPFRPGAFGPFEAAVAASRALPPLTPERFAAGAPVLAARLQPLLARQDGAHWAVAPASGVRDPEALARDTAALNLPRTAFLDTKQAVERLLDAYGRATLLWSALGAGVVLALLRLGLGGWAAAARAALPIVGAVAAALAALALAGEALNLFHLAALLLLAGLAIDYGLFLGRAGEDPAALEAVLSCVLSTLLTFGLLAASATPVLRGIGLVVVAGTVAAFLFALLLQPRRPA